MRSSTMKMFREFENHMASRQDKQEETVNNLRCERCKTETGKISKETKII